MMSIFLALRKHKIVLNPVWISRESEIIQWADSGSRDFISDDYSLDPVSFQSLESLQLTAWALLPTQCVRNFSSDIPHQVHLE